jgi:hypothetical protein
MRSAPRNGALHVANIAPKTIRPALRRAIMASMPAAPPLIAEALWRRVRAVFARARAAIGGGFHIAAVRDLGESVRRNIIARLAPLEAMVRKLLLAEAARFAGDAHARLRIDARRGVAPARQTPSHRQAPALDLSQPETWPVRFALALPGDPRVVADDRAPRVRALWGDTLLGDTHARYSFADGDESVGMRVCHPAEHTKTAFRLARRVEALRRVLDDPLPYARRLARLLVSALRGFPEIVRRYAMAPARTGDYDAEDPRLLLECISNACAAEPRFSSA